jgi:putative hydrolase of the HAD superfamily
MTTLVVVLDVGDVLVRTVPAAQYRALAARAGCDHEQVAQVIEHTGIVHAFERGELTAARFAAAVSRALDHPHFGVGEIRECWNALVGDVDPLILRPARLLASAGRLVLASNTNPYHWEVARQRLSDAGLSAPACLSFEIGRLKPDPSFFEALAMFEPRLQAGAVYIDDRAENVAVAARRGWTGWLHHEASGTARYLDALVN